MAWLLQRGMFKTASLIRCVDAVFSSWFMLIGVFVYVSHNKPSACFIECHRCILRLHYLCPFQHTAKVTPASGPSEEGSARGKTPENNRVRDPITVKKRPRRQRRWSSENCSSLCLGAGDNLQPPLLCVPREYIWTPLTTGQETLN